MSLEELNVLVRTELTALLTQCCGSSLWVQRMCNLFPFKNAATLFKKATETWYSLSESDWREAFTHHPKIGDIDALKEKFAATATWAAGEQSAVKRTSQQVLEQLSEANRLYEDRFGYIFIVCATGKSAEEMLSVLQNRYSNKPEDEITIAMEEQNKITLLRLKKLIQS